MGAEDYPQDWESLKKHKVPEWFKDAKLGIYAHWGVYCVPAHGSEWYPRNMYRKGSGAYKHHVETYGDPSEFGYKDFIPMFKAEKFDAEAWADLYEKAGAKFAGPVAEHHDGFSMWASKVNRWNSVDMGPKRDITGELAAALRKRGIKIITSFHHAYNFQGYYTPGEGWDTADSECADLYGQFEDPEVAHERWFIKIKEVIDNYQPDQIWYDFGLARIPDAYKRRMAAYYYGKEKEWGKEVIITRKGDHLPEGVGVLDIERGKMEGSAPFLWQTDDSVAVNSWCWVEDLKIKPKQELVHELIDIVSKNGVLLLNVAPKEDGTFPEDQRAILLELGKWLDVNGEAIYGTRPWVVHGEGPNLLDPGRGFHREAVEFSARDIRFTSKPDALYVICLGWPDRDVKLRSLLVDNVRRDAKVSLLGYPGEIRHRLEDGHRLVIDVPDLAPEKRPGRYAYTFKILGITGKGYSAVNVKADQAVLEGPQIGVEEKSPGIKNIGFWNRADAKVHWLVKIPEAGNYLVRGDFAAAAGVAWLALEANGQTIFTEVPSTAGWDSPKLVDMGSVRFDGPGVYHLVLRAGDPARWNAVNVWQLELGLVK